MNFAFVIRAAIVAKISSVFCAALDCFSTAPLSTETAATQSLRDDDDDLLTMKTHKILSFVMSDRKIARQRRRRTSDWKMNGRISYVFSDPNMSISHSQHDAFMLTLSENHCNDQTVWQRLTCAFGCEIRKRAKKCRKYAFESMFRHEGNSNEMTKRLMQLTNEPIKRTSHTNECGTR